MAGRWISTNLRCRCVRGAVWRRARPYKARFDQHGDVPGLDGVEIRVGQRVEERAGSYGNSTGRGAVRRQRAVRVQVRVQQVHLLPQARLPHRVPARQPTWQPALRLLQYRSQDALLPREWRNPAPVPYRVEGQEAG